jgi:hypothetical protein
MHGLLKMLSAGTASSDALVVRFGPSFASAMTAPKELRRELWSPFELGPTPSETSPGEKGFGEDGRERCEI